MILHMDGKEYKVELHSILSQKLYTEVTPLLAKLETSFGARKAFETLLQKKLFADSYFSGKVNLLQGENAWESLKNDMRFQETIAEVMITIRENIFEHITIDDETIVTIFDLFRVCINKKKIVHAELNEKINEPSTSEFWQEQDLNAILETLKFFRSNVLARIKTSI